MLLSFTNSKGGVGKSTLAVHLASWLTEKGKRVALVDVDVLGSSSAWIKEASPQTPLYRLLTPDDVLEQLPNIQNEFEFVVVDGPGGLSEVTRAVLLTTDVTLLPCTPSLLDLRAVDEAIRVVRQVQKIRKGPPKAILIPNRLSVRHRLSQELLETAKSLGIPVASGLRYLQAYADAVGQGTVVWHMGPAAAQAAGEIQQLFTELMQDEFSSETVLERRVENA